MRGLPDATEADCDIGCLYSSLLAMISRTDERESLS